MEEAESQFQLPIRFAPGCTATNESIIEELEFHEKSGPYAALLPSSTGMGKRTMKMWADHFTDDTSFLRENAAFIKRNHGPVPSGSKKVEDIVTAVKAMRTADETGRSFLARYQYVEWEQVAALNRNPHLLQWLCMYNMSSPVFALLLPLILLFLPLIVLRLRGAKITLSAYTEGLKQGFGKHPLGALVGLGAGGIPMEKRLTASLSVGFYCIQVYQNVRACVQFCRNMKEISSKLTAVKAWLAACLDSMREMERDMARKTSWDAFAQRLRENRVILEGYSKCLESFTPIHASLRHAKDIGHAMRCFYLLNQDDDTVEALDYALHYCGFVENLADLRKASEGKVMRRVTWIENKPSEPSMHGAVMPSLKNARPNTISLSKSILVTGPNAAGKTTLLKTTAFNTLLAQQIGLVCAKRAHLKPYSIIMCYINVPDTGGRDSLFQAEARRCLEILDSCKSAPTKRAFCIFDELFSGTNPYEAVAGGTGYLEHLGKACPNLTVMVTTHYLEMCQRLGKSDHYVNRHMDPVKTDAGVYPYRLKEGICSWRGGVDALEKLGYPEAITDRAKHILADET